MAPADPPFVRTGFTSLIRARLALWRNAGELRLIERPGAVKTILPGRALRIVPARLPSPPARLALRYARHLEAAARRLICAIPGLVQPGSEEPPGAFPQPASQAFTPISGESGPLPELAASLRLRNWVTAPARD